MKFAQKAMEIQKKYESRKGDAIAEESMDYELQELISQQEGVRRSLGLDNSQDMTQHGNGGGIHIKKGHEGRFTEYLKRTGNTLDEALNSKDPHVRQMANFARNAKKWKHDSGGYFTPDDFNNYYPQVPPDSILGPSTAPYAEGYGERYVPPTFDTPYDTRLKYQMNNPQINARQQNLMLNPQELYKPDINTGNTNSGVPNSDVPIYNPETGRFEWKNFNTGKTVPNSGVPIYNPETGRFEWKNFNTGKTVPHSGIFNNVKTVPGVRNKNTVGTKSGSGIVNNATTDVTGTTYANDRTLMTKMDPITMATLQKQNDIAQRKMMEDRLNAGVQDKPDTVNTTDTVNTRRPGMGEGWSYLPMAAGLAASFLPYMNRLKESPVNYPRTTPGYVNYEPIVKGVKESYDTARNITRQNLETAGVSQGQYLTNLLASNADLAQKSSQQVNNLYTQQSNYNAGERARADQYNAQIGMNEDIARQQEKDALATIREQRLMNVSQNLQGLISDVGKNRSQYDIANMIQAGNHKMTKDGVVFMSPDGKWYYSDGSVYDPMTNGKKT